MEPEARGKFQNIAWTSSEHCEQYGQHIKDNQALLQDVWDDLEVPSDEQTQKLLETAHRAENVWVEAVRTATRQRGALRESIEEARRRVAKIQAELSDEVFPDEENPEACPKSLKAVYEQAENSLKIWLKRRAQRQQRYEELKERCKRLRSQMGMSGSSVPVKSITLFVLDGAEMELRKLEAELVERRHRLEVHLKELRKICLALGEDEGLLAAAIHTSLGDSRDAQSSEQDLSDRTFDGLREKNLELQELCRAREEEGEQLLGMLQSLWDALEVPEYDVDRELFGRLLSGPSKLHKSTVDKSMQEVGRLEGARKDLMLNIIKTKRQELTAICTDAHIQMPNLPDTAAEPGEVADLLGRTLKQISLVKAEVEQRSEVMGAIQTLNTALTEDEWLTHYENDPNKYKGRDSTRNIQKAIIAQEHRKQLPSLVESVEDALQAYGSTRGKAFKYEGRDYQVEVLLPLKLQLQEDGRRKSQSGGARNPMASAKKPAKTPVTPGRRPPKGYRGSQDGGTIRKPALPTTPRTGGSIQRTASTLSRADSNVSRYEADLYGTDGLSERMGRLLHPISSSPAVSRTVSGVSDTADRERYSQTPDQKVSTVDKGRGDDEQSLFFNRLNNAEDEENKKNAVNTAATDYSPSSLAATDRVESVGSREGRF